MAFFGASPPISVYTSPAALEEVHESALKNHTIQDRRRRIGFDGLCMSFIRIR